MGQVFPFVSPVSTGEEQEGAAPGYQTTTVPRDGEQSSDDALKMPI